MFASSFFLICMYQYVWVVLNISLYAPGVLNISLYAPGVLNRSLYAPGILNILLYMPGGYNLTSICDASEMCMRALLGENVPLPNQEEILKAPCPSAVKTLEDCSSIQGTLT